MRSDKVFIYYYGIKIRIDLKRKKQEKKKRQEEGGSEWDSINCERVMDRCSSGIILLHGVFPCWKKEKQKTIINLRPAKVK